MPLIFTANGLTLSKMSRISSHRNPGFAAVAIFALAVLCAPPARASEDLFSLGVGRFAIFDDDGAADLRAEYRWADPAFWQIKPFAGVEGTTDGSVYGLGGVLLDWGISPHVYITPSFGAGLYINGGGKDMGYPVEFRSQIETSYEFESRHRVGAALSHISNAHLDSRNPGAESLEVYWHIPVGGSKE